ncbi:MAG TPA: TIR domain-containing protein [Gillisia sp.]|nr:TIR domain-containing protein [Gillisia sp.]
MARKTFFSFHYRNDVTRANIVRNSWLTKPNTSSAGFIDSSEFERIKKGGDLAIKNWIRAQLHGTSVTVVLIGSETNSRDYIKYELKQSYERGNGMLGIYVHNLKNFYGYTSSKGSNHFGEIGKGIYGNSVYFSSEYKCYDWINDDGYKNLGKWIEQAASDVGK